MNKTRLKQLTKVRQNIESAKDDLENLLDEEQCCFDNLPESFQDSEKGEKMQDWIDKLQNAVDYLGDACSEIEEE